jgi:hypothetical protein
MFTPFAFRGISAGGPATTPPYVTDGLIYYVDAGNTSSYPGSGTTWTDLSGQGRTTTLVNGPTFDSGNGGSINFDGSNDYAQVASGFNPNLTTKTMIGWVKLKNVSQQGGGLIGSGYSLAALNTFDTIVYNETNEGWGFGSNNFARTFWSNVKETSTNDWVMITGVYASGTNGYKMYRQDQLIAQGTRNVLSVNNANSGYWLGKRHATTTGPLNAYIAVGMIYNKALSATEIAQNYNHFKGRFGL